MRQKLLSGIAFVFCASVIGAGCAAVTETARGIAGVSTKVLEDGRDSAVKRSCPAGYAECREAVEGLLVDIKAHIYARSDEKRMIAFYMSESDTTPVGVFFVPQGDGSTEILVTSPSRYAKEVIADTIVAQFDKDKK